MKRIALIAAVLAVAASACSYPSSETTTTTAATTTEAPPPTLADAEAIGATAAAQTLLDAWAAGEFATVRSVSPDADHDLLGIHISWTEGLGLTSATYEVIDVSPADEGVSARYRAVLDLEAAGSWTYEGTLLLTTGDDDDWQVPWTGRVIHPSLEDGDTLVVSRRWPERAAILGSRGITLVTDRAVKTIGVVPQRIDDLDDLLDGLEEYAGIPSSTVLRELRRPGVQPDWYLPVGWMPLIDFLPVQSQLEAIEGLDLRDDSARLPPTGPFADHILGTTGPVTADLLAALGDPYRAGDIVGLSGLELEMEHTLAGYPTFEVQRVNQFGRVVEVLHTVPGVSSAPVRTTLSVDAQVAAEAALVDVELPAALVAIDAATGEIRAIASRPLDGFSRATMGLYPPGSTFKVVTAFGLLSDGYLPADTVACPSTITIGGREFRNAGEMNLGEVALHRAFSSSCNTTFASLAASELGADGLADAAAHFGFGTEYSITLQTAGVLFPDPPEEADVAAAAIGQGGVQVTPLHQASVAAAVDAAAWRQPTLITAEGPGDTIPLDQAVVESLRRMMRLVVTEGTGTAADVTGEQVSGKTGSAEWSEAEPTHAWFIGYWDGLGIAVVVESGGTGGLVAAPIAAAFIEALAG